MLAKRFRLKSRKLFDHTLRSSAGIKLCSNSFFAVYALAHTPAYIQEITKSPSIAPSDNPLSRPLLLPKFGIIVSKKVHKRANRRNRIKRRLREAIRTQLLVRCAKALTGYRTIILIVRTGALEAPYQTLSQALLTCFEKRNG